MLFPMVTGCSIRRVSTTSIYVITRTRPDGKVEWRAVGDGEFDNVGQIRALLKTGYKENFTLETHWRSPKGKAFATRTSLTALLKVIEQV